MGVLLRCRRTPDLFLIDFDEGDKKDAVLAYKNCVALFHSI